MRLDRNTLFNIAKHSNKTLKLADFVIKANRDIFYNKLSKLDTDINEVDLIEAFHSDLADTTKKIEDIHALLSTVDASGHVMHLKGEKNLTKIFGDAYNQEQQTLELPFTTIHLHRELDRDTLKYSIVNKLFGFKNNDEYDSFYKQRNNTFKLSENELHEDDEKIEYLASLGLRKLYQPMVDKMKEMVANNITFRKELSLEDKNLIDKEITFDKSMVDSVAKASLYITKEKGIEQWGSGFKTKYKKEVDDIVKALKTNPYVDAVEVDKDTDPKAFLAMLDQVKDCKFNITNPVTLKSRKLGVYNATGLYYPHEHIVAVDVKNPAAGIHEMIHAVDFNNDNISHSRQRFNIARALRGRIDKDLLASTVSKSRYGYYLSTEEIIARAGEITYLFEKYDFNPKDESYEEFKERVVDGQTMNDAYDLNLVKNIEKYENNANIYFNFTTMEQDAVEVLREYYKSYYRINHADELIPAPIERALPERKEHRVVSEQKRYEKTVLSGIKSAALEDLLNYNEENKIVDPSVLIHKLITESTTIGRTTKALYETVLEDQDKCFEVLCNWAYDNKKFYEMSRIVEGLHKTHRNVNIENVCMVDVLDKDKELTYKADYRDSIQVYKEQARELHKIREEVYEQIMNGDIPNNEFQDKMKAVQETYSLLYRGTILAPIKEFDKMYSKTEMFENLNNIQKNANYSDSRYRIKRQTSMIKMLAKTLERDGNEIANYFTKEDITPKAALFDKQGFDMELNRASRTDGRQSEPYTLNGFKEAMQQTLKASGEIENLLDMDNRFKVIATRGDYSVASCRTMDKSFMDNIVENIENNPNLIIRDASFNISKSMFNDQTELELINKAIPDLTDYKSKQQEVLNFKDSFEYKVVKTENNKPIEPEMEDVPDLVNEIVEKLSKTYTSEQIKKINEGITDGLDLKDDTPIDPNPPVEETKRRGRKKKVNPNQQRLF